MKPYLLTHTLFFCNEKRPTTQEEYSFVADREMH